MAQLDDYTAGVQLLGYDNEDTTKIEAAVQRARKRVFGDWRWSFLEGDSTSLATTAEDSTVSLAALTDLLHIDSVRHTERYLPLDWRPYQTLRELRQNNPDYAGPPRYWTRRRGELLLFPTPDAAYTLDISYVANPGELVDATDDVIPDQLSDLVEWAAATRLAFRQRDFGAASAAEGVYAQRLQRAAAEDSTEQRQTSRQVRSGYWG